MSRRWLRALILPALIVPVAVAVIFFGLMRSTTPAGFDVTSVRAPLITPGTVIADGPPADWTHLIVKSRPHPGLGDTNKIPALAKPLTRLIFTATLARVDKKTKAGAASYRLGAYAVGVGVSIKGQDTIVSPETQADLGAGLGFFARKVLSRSYAKSRLTSQVARSDTMVLMDAPAVIVHEGQHRDVIYRHAFLVDAKTGELASYMWVILLDDDGHYLRAEGPMVRFEENFIEEPALHVDGSEFTVGLPSDRAFALPDLPPGRKFEFPAELTTMLGRRNLTAREAASIESRLRSLP